MGGFVFYECLACTTEGWLKQKNIYSKFKCEIFPDTL